MRIAVSRQLWSLVLAALVSQAASSGAHADLVITIAGASGGSETFWTFSGSSTAALSGTIRATGSTGTSNGDTWEMDGDPIVNSSIVDTLFTGTGNATVTVGGTTQNITQIFLDDDSPDANPEDDFGIRVDTALNYLADDASSWTGTLVVPISIDDLQLGSYTSVFNAPNFSAGADSIDINVVPEPSSLAMIGLAGLFGGAARYRRRKKTPAGEPAAN
jgi:hypothetical protein